MDAVWAVAFIAEGKGVIHVATYKGDLNGEKFAYYVD